MLNMWERPFYLNCQNAEPDNVNAFGTSSTGLGRRPIFQGVAVQILKF